MGKGHLCGLRNPINKNAWRITIPCLQRHHLHIETETRLKVVSTRQKIMVLKQCHEAPIWEWFMPRIYGDLGDGL